MTAFQETVKAVRTVYPKFSPACLSLSMRTYETGVMMTPRAKNIADSVQGSETLWKRTSENRAKSISFRCRLSPANAGIVKHKMEEEGLTSVQELLEDLLVKWATESRSPVDQTEERHGVETDANAVSTSENNTKN